MAIVKVKKFNLISFKNELNALLSKMQEFVEIDFRETEVDLSKINSKTKEEIEEKIYKIESILKKCRKYEEVKSSISKLREGKKEFSYENLFNYVRSIDVEEIIEKINASLIEEENLKKQNENIENEILQYLQWKDLDITIDDISKLKNKEINIGSISKKNFEKFKEEELKYSYVKVISETKKELNLVIISLNEENIDEILRKYNFTKITLDLSKIPKEIIEIKKKQLDLNNKAIYEHISNLKILSNNISDLEIYVEYQKNELLKEEVKEKFKHTENLNIVSGYIPKDREKEFIENIEKVCGDDYYLSFEDFDETSRDIPIKLKNNELFKPFESLTSTFSMPRYTEMDPTIFVAPAFFIFFGMMIGDLGYGLVMLVSSLISLYLFNLDYKTRISIRFLMLLAISSSIWGILYGSFFGFTLSNPLHIFSPTEDYRPVMNMSIIFGIIHILLALLLKASLLIKEKKYLDALYDVGFWIVSLFSIGIYIYNGNKIALYLMILSMIAIVMTGGRDASSTGGKIGFGLYALYGISGYLGDLISYVRLMALGLSGGFIAYAINLVASMIGYKSIMIIFTIIILILGHVFNLFLSMLGAYVHTSRLIYVEFFSKFYQGGGKAFKDFKIKEKYINIKK